MARCGMPGTMVQKHISDVRSYLRRGLRNKDDIGSHRNWSKCQLENLSLRKKKEQNTNYRLLFGEKIRKEKLQAVIFFAAYSWI